MQSTKTVFDVAILRNEFSRFARSVRGGRAGYGAGSSFLVDFNLLSHLKCLQGFRSFCTVFFLYGATRPLLCTRDLVAPPLLPPGAQLYGIASQLILNVVSVLSVSVSDLHVAWY